MILNLITNASEGTRGTERDSSQSPQRACDSARAIVRQTFVLAITSVWKLAIPVAACPEKYSPRSSIPFSTKFAGRGMGLAVVKGVVRSHECTINVVSVPGQGIPVRGSLPRKVTKRRARSRTNRDS